MVQKTIAGAGLTGIIVVSGVVAVAASIATLVWPAGTARPHGAQAALLTSGTDFGLSGDVGNLTPGVPDSLALTVTNPFGTAIRLRTVTITVPAPPAACSVANLTISGIAFTGRPPEVTVTGLRAQAVAHGSATVLLPIRLARTAANPCQHTTFQFTYSGTATVEAAERMTLISVTSVPDPSTRHGPVAFVATVKAGLVVNWRRPTGTVTFYLCTNPATLPNLALASACLSAVPLGPAVPLNAFGRAYLVTSSLPPGLDAVYAVFSPVGPGFAPSVSRIRTQRVLSGRGALRAMSWRSGVRPR